MNLHRTLINILLAVVVAALSFGQGWSADKPILEINEKLYRLYHNQVEATITVNLPDDEASSSVLNVALLSTDSTKPLESKAFRSPYAGPIMVSFDLSKRPKGVYTLRAELVKAKEVLTFAESRMMPYEPKPKVGFDKNGFMLVDGKPFFPVGMYTLQDNAQTDPKHEPILAEAKKAGFNTTVFYAYTVPTVTPLLDAAQRAGIKAFVYPTIPFSVRKKEVTHEDVVKDVQARMNHPALLGWYLVDEPEGIGKANMDMTRELYQTVKDTDQLHPCSLVIMSPGAAANFRDCSDIMWIDPYPIPSRPVTYVTECTKGAVGAIQKDKPLWVIPQAFDWSVWNSGKVNGVHRPTPEEERCMTYLALVHGAKGIIYWAHTGSRYYIRDYPEHWAYMKKLAGEMRDLTPVLLTLNADTKVSMKPDNATIDTMVKKDDDAYYIFAVNHEPESCTPTFTLPGLKSGARVEVLFENRTLKSNGSAWQDSFKPLEVHVYRVGAK